MAETASQTVFASPASKSVALRAPQQPTKAVAAETGTVVTLQAQEPVFPPEVFLLLVKQLAANKSLRTLLNFALANKACSALALPVVTTFPHRDVWLAIEDRDLLDGKLNGVFVRGVFRNKAGAQRYLESKLGWGYGSDYGSGFDDSDEPQDFETNPYDADGGDQGFTYLIKKRHLIGPLVNPEGHVWVRTLVRFDSTFYDLRAKFQGLFTSEQEARKGIKERKSDYEDEYAPSYRFESHRLRE